jgi:hypothetical protein
MKALSDLVRDDYPGVFLDFHHHLNKVEGINAEFVAQQCFKVDVLKGRACDFTQVTVKQPQQVAAAWADCIPSRETWLKQSHLMADRAFVGQTFRSP